MPKLLVLCEFPMMLGGERSLLAVLEGLGQAGYAATVACPISGPLAAELDRRGVSRVAARWRDASGRRRPLPELREEIARISGSMRPDLVHANSVSIGRVAGPVVAELGLPSVAHLRDIVRLRRAEIADLNRHRRVVAVSHATRDFHVAQGLTAEKSAVVYNGVDLVRFQPRDATGWLHRELGLPAGATLVGTIGQISLRKGLDVLLDAARLVADAPHNVHWLLIGQCHSQKDESRALLRSLDHAAGEGALAGRWHLLGERTDVDRILPELTLLVHPARQEPLGRILLEAAAAGAAIVTTDVGGTREIFPRESDAALLVRPDDAAELAAGLKELLFDPDRRRRLGRAARRAAQRFTIPAAIAGLLEQFELALHSP